MSRRGYTLSELLIVLVMVASLGLIVVMLYVVAHFIGKFW